MNRRTFLLLVCLVLSLIFAGWQWLRPYEAGSDPAARFKMVHASVSRDHANFWLDLYLMHSGDAPHDLSKPVALILADGRQLEPASTTMEGETGTAALGLRFWLDEADFAGPIGLQLNDGTLAIRTESGLPENIGDVPRHFTTRNW